MTNKDGRPVLRFYARSNATCKAHEPPCGWGLYRTDRLGIEFEIQSHLPNQATAEAIADEFNARLDDVAV